ncbi:MAG: hypothetical protein LBU88_08455 [Treponema sp.]|jgi:hypothetical protein|nr:hypothetical protein [Treponema sp.]
MKKLAIAGLLAAFISVSAYANLISFYIVETGLPLEGERNRSSMLWENAFLDVFFDAGFIVTNYPMMRLPEKPRSNIIEAAGFDIREAREAGVDYILIAHLDYSDPANAPDNISFYVFKVNNHLVVYEKQITGRNFRQERDAIEELRKIVRELVPVISSI